MLNKPNAAAPATFEVVEILVMLVELQVGNCIDDKWFDYESFYDNKKEE